MMGDQLELTAYPLRAGPPQLDVAPMRPENRRWELGAPAGIIAATLVGLAAWAALAGLICSLSEM